MDSFWLKMAIFAVVVVGLIILVKVFSLSQQEIKPEKTVYDVWQEDDKRLRAKPEVQQPAEAKQAEKAEQPQATTPAVTAERPTPSAQPAQPTFKKLSAEDEAAAQKLFEMALFHRKAGRLPGLRFKKMVDYCREIIERWPDSEYAYKAKRMLADIPERYRKRYNVTDEEISPFEGRR